MLRCDVRFWTVVRWPNEDMVFYGPNGGWSKQPPDQDVLSVAVFTSRKAAEKLLAEIRERGMGCTPVGVMSDDEVTAHLVGTVIGEV